MNKEAGFSAETSIAVCKATQHTYREDDNMAAFSTNSTRVHTAHGVIHFKVYNDPSQMQA
jgi:hypothetical protein